MTANLSGRIREILIREQESYRKTPDWLSEVLSGVPAETTILDFCARLCKELGVVRTREELDAELANEVEPPEVDFAGELEAVRREELLDKKMSQDQQVKSAVEAVLRSLPGADRAQEDWHRSLLDPELPARLAAAIRVASP